MGHRKKEKDWDGKKKKKRHRRVEIGQCSKEGWEIIKRMYDYTCPVCGRREPDIKLTKDHIVPVRLGGTSYIENLQPMCSQCNQSKGLAKLYYPPPILVGTLES
jgi:5-methylcytosine-specific restriction endonuclease McrA